MTKQNYRKGRDLKIGKDLPWWWRPDPIMDVKRAKRLVGLECLKELERKAFLEIARGMFSDEISDDARLEVNENVINQIYYVAMRTEQGDVLNFSVLKSALAAFCEAFSERKSK